MTGAMVTLGRATILAIACILLIQGVRAWASAGDRNRRAHEIAAHQHNLYRQLADKDAVLESQRRVYMERLRKLEAQVREREQDVVVLRGRLLSVSTGVNP